MERIVPLDGGIHRVMLAGGEAVLARKVVLATGIQGGGEWHTPPMIRDALPRALYAHTSEAIDFEALKGKRIGILGGGASAFDNANWALETGRGRSPCVHAPCANAAHQPDPFHGKGRAGRALSGVVGH